jgi:phosphotransferase system enzyme I (PtsI)
LITLTGKSVCEGIVFGKLYIYPRKESTIKRRHVSCSDAEIERFQRARIQACDELSALYQKAIGEVGKSNAMIFQIHQLMLEDPDYIESIKNIITDELLNAETAVGQTCDSFVQMFASMEDNYIRSRSADIQDVSERVIRILEGKSNNGPIINEPVILAANDLAPSETIQIDKSKILGFITEGGSENSHTSILARMMNIPAIIGVSDILNHHGENIIVDGFTGTVYIDPDEETIVEMKRQKQATDKEAELLKHLHGVPNVTKDGQHIRICANITNVLDSAATLANDADGIGLFRSEFLYLENRDFPDEETQFDAYKRVLAIMPNKRVVIRTLDTGADKHADYYGIPYEENPAMGIRAIRLCLRRPEIFKTQLRALYRASVYGKLAIMFPMISSEWEIVKIISIINEVKQELDNENIPYSDNVELGCMVETPAAAIISDILTKHLDFISIGTNDLSQHALAADRCNPYIGNFYDSHHKSVLRLIKIAADSAHKNGAWVSICGDLAADTELIETFLAMEIDELSVIPNAILPLRKKVIDTDVSKVKDTILTDILN